MKNIEERLKKKLVELVEERFPKGNKERGNATVTMSLFFVAILKEIEKAKKEAFTEAIKLKVSERTHDRQRSHS